ncbi:MAG: CoA-binding protein, partial [Candidatus Micrarchaeota archaeon]|nr:CoA-binding protein [Candidatus Micrarchaeota archaeon]
FRKSEDVPAVVEDALARWPQGYGKDRKSRVIWMQLGIVNEAAAKKAEEKGWKVVQNRCLKIEHARLQNADE